MLESDVKSKKCWVCWVDAILVVVEAVPLHHTPDIREDDENSLTRSSRSGYMRDDDWQTQIWNLPSKSSKSHIPCYSQDDDEPNQTWARSSKSHAQKYTRDEEPPLCQPRPLKPQHSRPQVAKNSDSEPRRPQLKPIACYAAQTLGDGEGARHVVSKRPVREGQGRPDESIVDTPLTRGGRW